MLDSLKEFDLVLLSKTAIETQNVKKLTSPDFLRKIQSEDGKMLAIVTSKRKHDNNYIEIKVDIKKKDYLAINCSNYNYHEMHVYFFDSMSTRIREFRTVKSAEFYPNANYLLDPSTIPPRKDESELKYSRDRHEMTKFIEEQGSKFNES